jgi:hypothetical protein
VTDLLGYTDRSDMPKKSNRKRAPKKNPAAQALGRLGGSANTTAQLAQRRAAAKFAGRPRRVCATCAEPALADGRHKDAALDARCHGRAVVWQKRSEQ